MDSISCANSCDTGPLDHGVALLSHETRNSARLNAIPEQVVNLLCLLKHIHHSSHEAHGRADSRSFSRAPPPCYRPDKANYLPDHANYLPVIVPVILLSPHVRVFSESVVNTCLFAARLGQRGVIIAVFSLFASRRPAADPPSDQTSEAGAALNRLRSSS